MESKKRLKKSVDATNRSEPRRETELYLPIKEYLEKHGYQVKSEVLGIDVTAVKGDELVADLLGRAAQHPYPLPVISSEGRLLGVVSRTRLLRFLDRQTPPLPPDATATPVPGAHRSTDVPEAE